MDNGDPSFPSSRFLGVACVIVPKGSPPPLEWMAAHPNYVTVRGVIIPRAPLELDMELEPRPESEGQAEPLPEKPTYRVEIDYAGNWIIKGVTVMMPQPAPQTEPPSAAEADRLFEARCQAAWEAAQSPEVQARIDQIAAIVPQASAAGPMRHRYHAEPPAPPPWPRGISQPEADRLFKVGYQAARQVARSPASNARTEQLIKIVGEAIIAQARADGIGVAVAGAVVADPVVDAVIVAALAALGVVVAAEYVERILMPEGEQPSVSALSPGMVFHGFRPPPPRPPLPGLVPPPVPQTKPGEGGFTPAPPTRPLPGFTPLPPSVPVHPGRPVEANKPIIVSHNTTHHKPSAAKGPLPQSKADTEGVRRYDPDVPEHVLGAAAEKRLAHEVHGTPDEQVVEWGGPIGSHGADVVSVNIKTGAVTLWDAKYRRGPLKIGKSGKAERKRVRIRASPTFKAGKDARANAIEGAIKAIRNDKTLPPAIRDKAVANLQAGRIRTITTGFGKANNSVIGK